MEHHANIVPWQMAAERTGAKLVVAGMLGDGSLDMEDFKNKLSPKTKIVSVAHASNVLGTVNDIAAIGDMARQNGSVFRWTQPSRPRICSTTFPQRPATSFRFPGTSASGLPELACSLPAATCSTPCPRTRAAET